MEKSEIKQIVQILEKMPGEMVEMLSLIEILATMPEMTGALVLELRKKQFAFKKRMRDRQNFFGLTGRRPTGFVRAKI